MAYHLSLIYLISSVHTISVLTPSPFSSLSQLQYQRAHVLLALDHYEDAIAALDMVLVLAPKEPPVYSLLGERRLYGQSTFGED
jgi:predicted Zn-dependent protease